jgi:hypothetical protein
LGRPLDEQIGRARVHALLIANHDGSDCFDLFVHQTALPCASRPVGQFTIRNQFTAARPKPHAPAALTAKGPA